LHAFPHTLRVDSRFSGEEQAQIVAAIDEWSTATGGIVQINPVVTDGLSTPTHIGTYNSEGLHTIYSANGNNPVFDRSTLVGFTDIPGHGPGEGSSGNNIWIIPARIKHNAHKEGLVYKTFFRQIVLHELGHHFGLRHPPLSEHNRSLMQRLAEHATPCIAPADLERFCRLYDCSGHSVKTTCTPIQLFKSQHIARYE